MNNRYIYIYVESPINLKIPILHIWGLWVEFIKIYPFLAQGHTIVRKICFMNFIKIYTIKNQS